MFRINTRLRWGLACGIVCVLFWLILGCSTQSTPATNVPEVQVTPLTGQYEVVGDVANLRAGPGSQFTEVGQLNKGQVVDVRGVSEDGQWFLLASPASEEGAADHWVSSVFLAPLPLTPTPLEDETIIEETEDISSTPEIEPSPSSTFLDFDIPSPTITIWPGPIETQQAE